MALHEHDVPMCTPSYGHFNERSKKIMVNLGYRIHMKRSEIIYIVPFESFLKYSKTDWLLIHGFDPWPRTYDFNL